MTHLERLAFQQAKALAAAESALESIRQVAEEANRYRPQPPFVTTILSLAVRGEADIARFMKEEPEE